ncbi:unnamed protein product [Diplocarpon coronariae]
MYLHLVLRIYLARRKNRRKSVAFPAEQGRPAISKRDRKQHPGPRKRDNQEAARRSIKLITPSRVPYIPSTVLRPPFISLLRVNAVGLLPWETERERNNSEYHHTTREEKNHFRNVKSNAKTQKSRKSISPTFPDSIYTLSISPLLFQDKLN